MQFKKDFYRNYADLQTGEGQFLPSDAERKLFSREFVDIPMQGSKVLDVGFGRGAFLAWAQECGAVVSGIEIQDELLIAAAKRGIETYDDINKAPKNQYDIVVLLDVLEHQVIDEIPLFMKEILRVLKPGGIVLFRFPNCQSPAGLANQFGDHTHLSMLSGPFVEFFAKQAGFEKVVYREAKKITSAKTLSRVIRLLIAPLLYAFEYAYRLSFTNRKIPISPNIFLSAKKPE